MPKHWFVDPLNQSLKMVVRPPTKLTRTPSRRKEVSIDMKLPTAIFLDLMNPMGQRRHGGLRMGGRDEAGAETYDGGEEHEDFHGIQVHDSQAGQGGTSSGACRIASLCGAGERGGS